MKTFIKIPLYVLSLILVWIRIGFLSFYKIQKNKRIENNKKLKIGFASFPNQFAPANYKGRGDLTVDAMVKNLLSLAGHEVVDIVYDEKNVRFSNIKTFAIKRISPCI